MRIKPARRCDNSINTDSSQSIAVILHVGSLNFHGDGCFLGRQCALELSDVFDMSCIFDVQLQFFKGCDELIAHEAIGSQLHLIPFFQVPVMLRFPVSHI